MTALINRIDANKHPKLFFSLLFVQKYVLPSLTIIFFVILLSLVGPMFVDNLTALQDMELTDAEQALFNMNISALAFFGILLMWRMRR